MAARVFSLAGRNLRLDTADDARPYADELAALTGVTEVRFGGNTIGVPAAEALAAVLRTKTTLQVGRL